MIVGSRDWLNWWADLHWKLAEKFASRCDRPDAEHWGWAEQAMYHQFKSYFWRDLEPWA